MQNTYMYMWEYHVSKNHIDEFEKAYGLNGDWVNLFKKAEGYIETELHKDINNEGRYITVDYWQSKEACINFRNKYQKEFNEIDERCETYTVKEISLGEFYKIEK